MTQVTIRDYDEADAGAVLALNQANVPEVGPLDLEGLGRLAAESHWMPVAELEGQIVGFAILLVEGADYASTNYGWFSSRHKRFLYVDRIALAPEARGQGLGKRLYAEAVERARTAQRPVLAAEVNTVPMNEPSLGFHRQFGFEERERRCPYGDDAEVVMLELSIPS